MAKVSDLPPGQQAELNRMVAEIRELVRMYAEAYRLLRVEHGSMQATADLVALVTAAYRSVDDAAVMLVSALSLLADEQDARDAREG